MYVDEIIIIAVIHLTETFNCNFFFCSKKDENILTCSIIEIRIPKMEYFQFYFTFKLIISSGYSLYKLLCISN